MQKCISKRTTSLGSAKCLSVSVSPSVSLSVCLPVCLSAWLAGCLPVCLHWMEGMGRDGNGREGKGWMGYVKEYEEADAAYWILFSMFKFLVDQRASKHA